jgi:hypothetical protein
MNCTRLIRILVLGSALVAGAGCVQRASAQGDASRNRSILKPYVGQEVLVVDTTSGTSQFLHDDALLLYRLKLNAVQKDYIIVSRDVEGDKRAFVYPLSVIRRVTTASGGVPLRPIVIELY